MFTVKCDLVSLWHPAVHHSLLLLRALKQRHTLLLEPSSEINTRSNYFWRLSQYNSRLSIIAPSNNENIEKEGKKEMELQTLLNQPSLLSYESKIQSVYDPQHILYFFSFSPSFLPLKNKIETYLDAAVITNKILQAVDDVLVALSTTEMEVIRQTHSNLMDLIARLDNSLQNDETDIIQDMEEWSTWPIFTTLQFLIEEGGLLLGPFPRIAKAYKYLQESKPVLSHMRLIDRTIELSLNDKTSFNSQKTLWPYRGFLREVQRLLAEYTSDPAERMIEGVTGEKGPLRARVSGARFGLQPVSARVPWTMQREGIKKS